MTQTIARAQREPSCRSVATKRDALASFRRWPSPWIIGTGLVGVVVARLGVGAWSWWDLLAAAIFMAANPFTEWLMHRHILHGKPIRVGTIDVGNGVDHAKHHDDPPQIEWLLLSASDAITNQIALAALVSITTAIPMWLLGAPIVAPTLTVAVLTAARLLEYEWNHFLFHTAYRPRTRRYQRLKQNHRLHHYRNENYWMGVTNTLGDRVLGTYKAKTEVELSPTARNLDRR